MGTSGVDGDGPGVDAPEEGGSGRLAGRAALITGASRGIGRAVARALAREGAATLLLSRGKEGRGGEALEAVAREVGGRVVRADLADAEGLAAALDGPAIEGLEPDIVVNAAGVFDLARLSETSLDVLDRNLDVNLRGAFLVTRAVLPGMLARGRGIIVNVGSVAGRRAFPGNAAYSAAKYGVRGMHEVLLEELRGTGVRATLLEPSAVDTEIWDPLDPDAREDLPSRSAMLDPEDVADATLFAVTRPPGVQIPVLPVESV